MKQIDKDRKELQRLVESYGKQDVMKYVNHLDEGTLNESFLGAAGIIVAGLIGFKLIKSLLLGLVGGALGGKIKQKIAELEQCQAEMTEILSRYPDVQENFTRLIRNRLNYVKMPENSYSLGEKLGLGLDRYLTSFEPEDRDRFLELFNKVRYIQDEAFKYYKEETLEKLGGKTSFASKLDRMMFN